jgi:hypothetical protein
MNASMRDELRRIGVRAVRITLAIFLAGVALHAGFNVLRTSIQQHVFAVQVRTSDETYMRDHGIAPAARIARRIVFDVTSQQLRASQALVIRHDRGLCTAIHESLLRGKNNVPSPPAEWALGSLNIDGIYVPFESNAMTIDETADACSVTASADPSRLFRGEDGAMAPSDVVRYRNYGFRANTLDVLFRANGVRVDGVTELATSQKNGVTTFTWKAADPRQMREVDFRLTRPAGAQRKISDVVTRVDENWLPYLTPPLTALLVALPYALFVVFGRRHARPERARLIGMGEWLLTLYFIVHLTYAVVQLWDWLAQHALTFLEADSFLGGETFGALLAVFACIVWPLLIARWMRSGKRSWISEPGPLIPRSALIATIAFIAWAGVAGYSKWVAPVPAVVIIALAILAFVAGCWWLMREIGGGIFHTLVLIIATTIVYLARDRFAFWITWPLAALFLLSLVLLVRAAFTNARAISVLRFVILLLVCLAAAKMLLPAEFFTPYWELHELVDASNDLALFAILAAFLILLRDHSQSGAPSLTALRLGFALALSFFYTARYGLYGAVVFILGYLLLRYGLFIPRWRREWQQLDASTIRAGVAKVIAMHEAERVLDGLRKTARAEVAEGKRKWADYEKLTREMEAVVSEYRKDEAAFKASSRALARGSTEPPWKRGLYAARIAMLLAIPWCFLYLAVASHRDIPQTPQWWLQIVATFIFAAVQWPLFGFFFAYFYPEIRGDHGLAKSLVYFVTIVVPPVLAFVIFDVDQAPGFELFALWVFQNFIQAMVLGLFAGDYRTLKEFGLSWRHLRDVHNLGVLSAYGSSIIVAVGGAISTPAGTGVIDLLKSLFMK